MRTYSLRPGLLARALERIALGVEERTKLSPLGGLWYSDIGRRDQIVHLWPYDSLAHRESVRGRFGELKNWPAKTTEFTVESETKILAPAPFTPPLTPGKRGPVYEICTDTCHPESLMKMTEAWSARISERKNLIGAWQTTLGPMYQWIHIWAYESFEQRLRAAPPGDELCVKRESGIYFPAAFSPLQ